MTKNQIKDTLITSFVYNKSKDVQKISLGTMNKIVDEFEKNLDGILNYEQNKSSEEV